MFPIRYPVIDSQPLFLLLALLLSTLSPEPWPIRNLSKISLRNYELRATADMGTVILVFEAKSSESRHVRRHIAAAHSTHRPPVIITFRSADDSGSSKTSRTGIHDLSEIPRDLRALVNEQGSMLGWSAVSVLLDIAYSVKVLPITPSHVYSFAVEPLISYQPHRKARLPALAFGRGGIHCRMTFGRSLHPTYNVLRAR